MTDENHRYGPGDHVLVTGGYDGADSAWLAGGRGYAGVIRAVSGDHAAVELDDELELRAQPGREWQDFGSGSPTAISESAVARGRWLVLSHGWVGQTWSDPVRLQVGLCNQEPDLDAIPRGGGIGYWVESHAGIRLIGPAERT